MSFTFGNTHYADPILPPCRTPDFSVAPLSLLDIPLCDLDVHCIKINNTPYYHVSKTYADGVLFTLQHTAKIITCAGTRFLPDTLPDIPNELYQEIGMPEPFVLHLLHISENENPFAKSYSLFDLRSIFGAAHFVGRQAAAWIEEAIRRCESLPNTRWIWNRPLGPLIDSGRALEDSDSDESGRSMRSVPSNVSLYDESEHVSRSVSPEDLSRRTSFSYQLLSRLILSCRAGALILHPTLSSQSIARAPNPTPKTSPVDPIATVAELLARLGTREPEDSMNF